MVVTIQEFWCTHCPVTQTSSSTSSKKIITTNTFTWSTSNNTLYIKLTYKYYSQPIVPSNCHDGFPTYPTEPTEEYLNATYLWLENDFTCLSTSTLSSNQLKRDLPCHYQSFTETWKSYIRSHKSNQKHLQLHHPINRPTLLASGKMSNTVPKHTRLGFRLLKYLDILHDVCQHNFSLHHLTECPLELGKVANINKARRNKLPIEWPPNFLEVVHCDIGYTLLSP
jgi:hypothetical protein